MNTIYRTIYTNILIVNGLTLLQYYKYILNNIEHFLTSALYGIVILQNIRYESLPPS
jgi:hypothetical protein